MADYEKVVKGLQSCSEYRHLWTCPQCPYYKEEDKEDYAGCTGSMAKEALELINELKDTCRILFNRCMAVGSADGMMCGFCGLRDRCDEMRSTGRKNDG